MIFQMQSAMTVTEFDEEIFNRALKKNQGLYKLSG